MGIYGRSASIAAAVGAISACGLVKDITNPPGGGGLAANPTAQFVLKNGMPGFLTLTPQLPDGFSTALGVAGAADGQPDPARVRMSRDVEPLAPMADFEELLGETRSLAAWGFSETRRIEVLAQSLLAPIFDLLGRGDLFQKSAQAPLSEVGAEARLAGGGGSLFGELLKSLQFAVRMPVAPGFPSFLVLSSTQDVEGVLVRGVWPQASGLAAGFSVEMRLSDPENQVLSFALAPGRMPGLVKSWKASSCADDVLSIHIARNSVSGRRSLTLRSWECPSGRNAVGVLSVSCDGSATAVESAFAQNFENLTGPRGMLGARQGFVLQAAAQGVGSDSRLAAGIALAGAGDFSQSLGALFANFSVASLLTQYVQSKYITPFSVTDAGQRLCDLASASSASADIMRACRNERMDPDPMVASVDALHSLTSNPMASLIPKMDTIRGGLSSLVQVLKIRNPIFVSGKNTTFGAAPEAAFQTLDDDRKKLSTLSLASLAPSPEDLTKLLPTYGSEQELPSVSFQGVDDGIKSFRDSQCQSLASEALRRAGMGVEGAGSLCSP